MSYESLLKGCRERNKQRQLDRDLEMPFRVYKVKKDGTLYKQWMSVHATEGLATEKAEYLSRINKDSKFVVTNKRKEII